jgi:hypothetical protein
VRQVVLFSYPDGDRLGFDPGAESGSSETEVYMRWWADGPGAPAALPLSTSLRADLPSELLRVKKGVYRFSGAVPAAADIGKTRGHPMLAYTSGAGRDEVAAGLHEYAPGAWKMAFFFDHAEFLALSGYLSTMWIDWGLRGAFLGARRIWVNMHLDDTFLATNVWQEELNGRAANKTYRITGGDLEEGRLWTERINAELPAGSNIKLLHAFNGAGVVLRGGPDDGNDPLFDNTAARFMHAYFWCSHTYTHPSLDEMSFEVANWELSRNVEIGVHLVEEDPGEYLETYSPGSMVTPMITGLFNGDALSAMAANGIGAAVGDNSRDELVPTTSLWHGIHTTVAEHGFNGFYIMPRHAALVYFDCSLPAENAAEYTFVNRARLGGRRVTMNEVFLLETETYATHFMFYRHDSVMFHQANLRFFSRALLESEPFPIGEAPRAGRDRVSLITHWLDVVSTRLLKYSTLPLLSHSLDDLHMEFLAREARDACGPEAVPDAAGTAATRVTLTFAGRCEIPLTGFVASDEAGRRAERINPGAVRFERYGPMRTIWVRPPLETGSYTVILAGQRAPVPGSGRCEGLWCVFFLFFFSSYFSFHPLVFILFRAIPSSCAATDTYRAPGSNADPYTSIARPVSPTSTARKRLTGGYNVGAPGEPYPIVVELYDDSGTAVPTGGATLTVRSQLTSSMGQRRAAARAAATAAVADHGNGTYTVAVTVDAPGVWSHEILLEVVGGGTSAAVALGSGPMQVLHRAPAPRLVSFEAKQGLFRPDATSRNLLVGDSLVLGFDRPTNRPAVGNKAVGEEARQGERHFFSDF